MAKIKDPITAQVINNALINAAEEAGLALQLSAFSPNIRERLDFSTAIYDAKGLLLAQAEHIPVHLGAMIEGVKFLNEKYDFNKLDKNDIIINNDPYLGGTHLPDISLTAPIFVKDKLVGIITNRAHHADVGGLMPGSMPGGEYTLDEEGYVIKHQFLIENNQWNDTLMDDFLSKVRSPEGRKGDLQAQIAGIRIGQKNIRELWSRYSHEVIEETIAFLRRRSSLGFNKILQKLPETINLTEVDFLDDDGVIDEPVKIEVTLTRENDRLIFDFSNSSPQTRGNINAPRAVSLSAVFYVIRSLIPSTYPTNAGLYTNLTIITKEGTVLHPESPAGVAGGNVETSQRIVDVVLKAFSHLLPQEIHAANCGSMNNIAIGSDEHQFTYYETIAGGLGAGNGFNGRNATHAAMTNTGNTPIEIFEEETPLKVHEYSIRWGSGGRGRWSGGCGIKRTIELTGESAVLSLLTDRRKFAPYGLFGGNDGAKGANYLIRDGKKITLKGKITMPLQKGDIIIIQTPGGGGYGDEER
ncbi:MAG: hydantoinase B/oxoprolinase family protein [Candidatus Kariarchaeaceae archaeon]